METKTTTTNTALTLQCLDGKDEHFKAEVETGKKLIFGSQPGNIPLNELNTEDGSIVITNIGGQVIIDALNCKVPVTVNGNAISKTVVAPPALLFIGNSVWKLVDPHANENHPYANVVSVKKHFNSLIGLEELQDFKLKDIFSKVFEKHSLVEMEDQLVTGTFNNTPALKDIETGWAKPWLFSRMLVISIAVCFILVMGFNAFKNINLIPGLIFVGSFAVPISTLIFFLEMNAPRNISIFMIMLLMVTGGVASLMVALIFFDRFSFFETALGAPAAGIIEESAKVLCVILIMGRYNRYRWILNGLLFGAAIGTGFAAFESSGYALNFMLQSNVSEGVDVIILRGILAPFGHIIWTGNAAAALWLVKGNQKFNWSMVQDMRFLRVFLSSVILHMIWDTSFSILPLPYVGDVKYIILGVIGWVITFRLIQAGLKQLNEARRSELEVLYPVLENRS